MNYIPTKSEGKTQYNDHLAWSFKDAFY